MAASDGEKGAAENSPVDWADIFAELVCHTTITRNDLPNMALPEIYAYRSKLGKNISLKMGLPLFSPALSAMEEPPQEVDNETKLSQLDQIERMFNR